MRSRTVAALALLTGVVLAGCGGGGSVRRRAQARDAGPIRMAMGGVETLDPARADTAQDTELDWVVYTGLVTYRHARGQAGTELIPGVATALPRVSEGGRLYTVTLRKGLRFSDGRALRASDVVATFERVIRTRDSPVRPLLLPVLSGAAAFASGDARSISGVSGDDATGRVTIRLTRPDPGFDALLAEPALGIVPAATPLHDRAGHPPAGVGPYRLEAVHPGRSFVLAHNPSWKPLPGIPAGEVDVDVALSTDAAANAMAVLNDVLDVEDPAEAVPSRALSEIRRQGVGRETLVAAGRPLAYLFLGSGSTPFDTRLARDAVIDGIGAQTVSHAAARTVSAACQVVPLVSGQPVPDGCASALPVQGGLTAARSLVARSGTSGALVTVWSPRSGPDRNWLREEAAALQAIGYVPRVVTIPDATYRSDIQALVPRPADPHSGGSASGHSSSVRPSVAHDAAKRGGVPTISATAVVDGRLGSAVRVPVAAVFAVAIGPDVPLRDARAAHQLAVAVPAVPELVSWRMDKSATVIDPVEGLDFTSLRLR